MAANSRVNESCLKRHGRWRTDSAKNAYMNVSVEKHSLVSKSLGLGSKSSSPQFGKSSTAGCHV